MALEGNLRDLSLSSIVQMICVEQRRTELVLRNRDEDGTMYFDRGDVVHATAGALEGEEAVYYLLGWKEGTFRANANAAIPRRTISAPWNHLLMEGMRKLDELERDGGQKEASRKQPSADELKAESALENQMILLLSTLDHMCVRLSERQAQRKPGAALQVLAEMVNAVAEFAEKYFSEASLSRAVADVAPRHPAANRLKVQSNRLQPGATAALADPIPGAAGGDPFGDASRALVALLEAYLSQLVAACFRTPRVVGEITEAYRILLADMGRALSGGGG